MQTHSSADILEFGVPDSVMTQVNEGRRERGRIFPFPVAASCVPRMDEIATSSHSFIVVEVRGTA